MSEAILVLNAGSSSIKFSVFPGRARPSRQDLVCEGECEGIGHQARFWAKDGAGASLVYEALADGATHEAALAALLAWLAERFPDQRLVAAGAPRGPWRNALRRPSPDRRIGDRGAAPAHSAGAAAPAPSPRRHCAPSPSCSRRCRRSPVSTRPSIMTSRGRHRLRACRATSPPRGSALRLSRPFLRVHRQRAAATSSARSRRWAGRRRPSRQRRQHVRDARRQERRHDHGFHRARRPADEPPLRRPRSGRRALPDPGKGHVRRRGERSALSVSRACSAFPDSATTCGPCWPATAPRRARRSSCSSIASAARLGSLAAALGGLDALVFTAGIGEHAPEIRRRVCEDAAWLGVAIDERRMPPPGRGSRKQTAARRPG